MTKKNKVLKPLTFSDDAVVVAIIHYNTPELTHACIGSLICNGGLGSRLRVVVFDNSDRDPFPGATGVMVIDNTEGQVIDFEAELAKYPERDRSIGCAKGCEFGSVKHMMTVQKLWELLPQGFILMESDILIKKSIADFVKPEYSFVGYAQKAQPHNPFGIGRILPMLCWMNVPLLTKYGARYYDPARTYGLLPGGRQNRNNWYDTGAVLLEEIIAKRPNLKGLHVDIRPYVVHFGSASWSGNDEAAHRKWLEQNRDIFPSGDQMQDLASEFLKGAMPDLEAMREPEGVAVCAIGRKENRYAVEWVEHYLDLGVDKIFIYDNNRPEDGEQLADVLQPYVDEDLVEITPWTGRQKQAYEDCYNRHNKEFAWMGFFDFDELLWIQYESTAEELLEHFDADVVVMNWKVMTDNGLLHYEPKPMKERFTEGRDTGFAINRHVKSFVHTGITGISFNDPHCPNAPKLKVVNVHGDEVKQVPIQDIVIHDTACINHYDTKTAEEWVEKNRRGWPDATKEISDRRKAAAIEIFYSINKRTKEKDEILEVLKYPAEKVEVQNGDPAVVKPSKPITRKSTNKKMK